MADAGSAVVRITLDGTHEFPLVKDDKLCATCRQINIWNLFGAQTGCQHSNLGLFRDVVARRTTCILCDLAVRFIHRQFRTTDHDYIFQRFTDGTDQLNCWVGCLVRHWSHGYARHYSDNSSSIRFWLGPWEGFVNGRVEVDSFEILLALVDTPKLGRNPWCNGRSIDPDKINYELVMNWIRDCQENDEECSVRSLTNAQRPHDLTVIDVELQCLTLLPPNSAYLTLSYCWGGTIQFVNKRELTQELFINYALKRNGICVSQTLRDAMLLTAALGERYLWVDALCIVQDDKELKETQIMQMHLVYLMAKLTIVALSGQSANDPLPGVSVAKREPQDCLSVQGLRVSITGQPLKKAIAESIWNTRGWTFQEQKLSRRLLYLGREQVYFQCCSTTHREDVSRREPFHGWILGDGGGNVDIDSYYCVQESFHRQLEEQVRHRNDYYKAYASNVMAYTERQFSNASDRGPAISGLLAMYRDCYGVCFWHGLPLQNLTPALIWRPKEQRSFESCSRTEGDLTKILRISSATIPSWSWLNHAGPINFSDPFYPDFARCWDSVISWYGVAADHSIIAVKEMVDDCKRHKSPRKTRLNNDEYAMIFESFPTLLRSESTEWRNKQPVYLLAIAEQAIFKVQGTRMLNEDDEEIGNATLDIALRSGEEYSTCVAFILLRKHSSAYPFLRQGTESKRLTLARSRRHRETFYPKEEIGYHRDCARHTELEKEQQKRRCTHLLYGKYKSDVLAVHWRSNGDEAIRIGVGRVSELAWENCKRTKVILKLM